MLTSNNIARFNRELEWHTETGNAGEQTLMDTLVGHWVWWECDGIAEPGLRRIRRLQHITGVGESCESGRSSVDVAPARSPA